MEVCCCLLNVMWWCVMCTHIVLYVLIKLILEQTTSQLECWTVTLWNNLNIQQLINQNTVHSKNANSSLSIACIKTVKSILKCAFSHIISSKSSNLSNHLLSTEWIKRNYYIHKRTGKLLSTLKTFHTTKLNCTMLHHVIQKSSYCDSLNKFQITGPKNSKVH